MRIAKRAADGSGEQTDESIHLTEEGLAHLKEKLARLKRALPNLVAETQRTAAFGDRSDNAEYKLAKSSLRRANWQILSIEDQLKRVTPITAGPDASGRVRIGSMVVLETDGAERTFRILGSHETDPARGRISYQSPLGAALMGRAKGDTVTIQTASGSRIYRILEIR